ncbi:3-deoxy-7-phosphoheptulonate synthase [Vibrio fluvialis]|uniref:3-deoxy-7-phosphoheptulonate synthase n=1 Tax=Vibrio fluvialis TaxID=676 RepID=UPI00192A91DE|nr:3-deoxy-7-phosphoheptulonate synthase [Vibrio fluvialis]EKO3409412.1 3-deoxy-7-phosphoheptulonate synthase [Vibrio fluvialis]ELP2653362.1 3-deoxy-7-phosphoheptulonate synthase [Vibrio fluvialis]MBL4296736.1 3-deoxy-7-phosphoheptulonate synthase [Vibrio fluvialis]MBY8039230.1 3-deoxy-7-phosphoheptulonate synthase [Vibrio fluvialis]MCE7614006.1 3-deoxy-7-phosphoheptulonate synthase [Vibrio fluvialis]
MKKSELSDINIVDEQILITPDALKDKLPLSDNARRFIRESRQTIADIIHKRDHRLLIVCGPCSIHDVQAAKEYAKRLKALSEQLKDQLYIVMRVYFEKPRTTVGWKGLINDPHLDGTFDIEHGLHVGRQLLVELAEMEIPLATEALDPISPQYLADTFSWAAIGARTTESQTHREMASGLSMPIGFKNGTDGSLSTAINAMQAASSSHRFMGINREGQVALLTTQGNANGHVILRGGKQTNYDSVSVAECEEELAKVGLDSALMVDCSHANSRKDYRRQPLVAEDVIHQIREGNQSIIGLMIESHLNEGNQSADLPLDQMAYGVSITDACINWASTEALLRHAHQELIPFLENRLKG